MAKRSPLKKGESAVDRVAKIEQQLKGWRTKLVRAGRAIDRLEKQRAYYTAKVVELGRTS